MLRGSLSRRVAAVLTTALVAVLLVPFAGTARITQSRATASPVHVTAAAHAVRAAHALPGVPPTPVHQLEMSTPPADSLALLALSSRTVETIVAVRPGTRVTPPTERGPPAL
ncbi:MAG: hypothetical protein JWP31_2680 [Aeromicrobium sp.]|nr:hypothetical protein [Aeromicrobium sp.]